MKNEVEILLVEDNMSDAEMTIRALRKNNILNSIVHLKNGEEALDFIFAEGAYKDRNINIKPKVVLLDLKMPKVNGIQVLQRVKSDERTKAIPVVILTSSKEDPDIKVCYEYGANSYVVKPVKFDSFMKAINELGYYWLMINQTQQ